MDTPDPKHAPPTMSRSEPFAGFALPTSNTTYTPNQFFDVCLPYSSGGVVRLVGYVIRKTLGWCDEHGHPQHERVSVSYRELSERAGISRDMIAMALAEAAAGGFILRTRGAHPNRAGEASVSAEYELAWDDGAEYVKDPKRFRGFFAGEGNRTYIPNEFFDRVLPRETLAVIKVVGAVIRFSIGFQTKWGHRRQQTALSYQTIQNYGKIRNRSTLAEALAVALQRHYVRRVEAGFFDPNAGRTSHAAVYALQWSGDPLGEGNGQKNGPGESTGSERSEIRTDHGQKNGPGGRSEKRPDLQIKESNKTSKQHADAAVEILNELKAAGFDRRSAEAIAAGYPAEQIRRQLQWIDRRRIRRSRLGMLRTAIAEDWEAPTPPGTGENLRQRKSTDSVRGVSFAQALTDAKRRFETGRRDPLAN